MSDLRGSNHPRFDAVRTALQRNLDSGDELGASLVVDIDGDTAVDLWGGCRDQGRATAWDEHTITNVWSTTKTVTSLAALMLVDRGEVDVHAPVARYWPEFGVRGKKDVEIRHLPAAVEDLFDWNTSTTRMAAQAPWWTPGTASGLGPDRRRSPAAAGRVRPRRTRRGQRGCEGTDRNDRDAAAANTPAYRRADIGATNGHGNARSVARILSVIAPGGEVDGVRLLRPETIEFIFDEQANGTDLVLQVRRSRLPRDSSAGDELLSSNGLTSPRPGQDQTFLLGISMSALQAAVVITMLLGGIWLGVIVTIAVERVNVWSRMPLDQYAIDFRRSVKRVDPLQPILSIATACGAALLALEVDGVAKGLAWGGFGLVVVVIVGSVTVGEPINTKFRGRAEGDPPPDAQTLRSRWGRFHRIRTLVAVSSFILLVSATAVQIG